MSSSPVAAEVADLAAACGVATAYTDHRGRHVDVGEESHPPCPDGDGARGRRRHS
ncbi:MAG: hypothetical protein H0W51_09625, partial [Euzebyales bacterium]|nr:hypothetical protein [Euzebyales bacterium]